MPASLKDLTIEIKIFFGLDDVEFRMQYMDVDFDNQYVNLTSTSEIKDKSTLRLITVQALVLIFQPCPSTSYLELEDPSVSSDDTQPCPTTSYPESEDASSISSRGTNDTVILSSSPESRSCTWPDVVDIPSFSFDTEMQLEKGNQDLQANGMQLIPGPKMKSVILEGLTEKMFKYTAYPNNVQISNVAEALVKTHPRLTERGSTTGFEGWKQSLKYKMANFRSRLGKLGSPEICVNSLKHKSQDQGKEALNVKKPKKAEVNYCPLLLRGETKESLENERLALLTEVQKRNNQVVVKEKMERTFSYRRQEVVQDKPLVADFKSRWPALFEMNESSDIAEAKKEIAETVMGINVIRKEGVDITEKPEDIGIAIEGVVVLNDLGNVALAVHVPCCLD
ncbi:hypothetical protein NQZ68_025159 [Dissostichus eleginoides]|nr:hypothetical protein NQZ68_025159 [Dissostichus eleginoides]